MKLKRSFASPIGHVVSIPKCIASYVQCSLGQIWVVYARFNTKSLQSSQMEVDFDRHLKLIWYKLKSFRSKSEQKEISQESLFIFTSHMIAIERMSSHKEKSYVCLEVLELFPLAEYAELLLWNKPNLKEVRRASQWNRSSIIAWQFWAWKFYNNFRRWGTCILQFCNE